MYIVLASEHWGCVRHAVYSHNITESINTHNNLQLSPHHHSHIKPQIQALLFLPFFCVYNLDFICSSSFFLIKQPFPSNITTCLYYYYYFFVVVVVFIIKEFSFKFKCSMSRDKYVCDCEHHIVLSAQNPHVNENISITTAHRHIYSQRSSERKKKKTLCHLLK